MCTECTMKAEPFFPQINTHFTFTQIVTMWDVWMLEHYSLCRVQVPPVPNSLLNVPLPVVLKTLPFEVSFTLNSLWTFKLYPKQIEQTTDLEIEVFRSAGGSWLRSDMLLVSVNLDLLLVCLLFDFCISSVQMNILCICLLNFYQSFISVLQYNLCTCTWRSLSD